MKSKISIVLKNQGTDLNESLRFRIDKDWWIAHFENDKIIAVSEKEYEVPGRGWDEGDIELDSKISYLVDKVAGRLRNLVYISFGIIIGWGLEATYGSTNSKDTLDMFPTIHDNLGSLTFTSEDIKVSREIFSDLGESTDPRIVTMLSYWRRADELDDLSYHAESYLNFFKVLECLKDVDENQLEQRRMLDRFAPIKKTGNKSERVPLTKIKRHLGKNLSNGKIEAHIKSTAKILASANYTYKVSSSFFIYTMDLINVRNHYNVAHNIMRVYKNDTYRGVGQHSDEFEHVIPSLSNIRSISKFMIINYVSKGKYTFNNIDRKWLLS